MYKLGIKSPNGSVLQLDLEDTDLALITTALRKVVLTPASEQCITFCEMSAQLNALAVWCDDVTLPSRRVR